MCDAAVEGVGEGVEIMLDAVLLLAIGTAMLMAGVVAIDRCYGCAAADLVLLLQRKIYI